MKNKPVFPDNSITSNKVYQTLAAINAPMHKRLAKFLQSPYFNQSKTLFRLYTILMRHIEAGKTGFVREDVWKKLFPGEKYDDVNFRKYCSDLLKMTEMFFSCESWQDEPGAVSIHLLNFVVKNKIEPLNNSSMRQARADIEQLPYKTLKDYYKLYAIEREYYYMKDFDFKLDFKANLEEISTNLDRFYWTEKIKLYSSALSHKRTAKYEYDLLFLDEILAYLKTQPIEEVPDLALHYYAFLTLKEEDNTDHYYKYKELLFRYSADMPKKNVVELYDSALYYCNGKINRGNNVFLQEYFDLLEDAIQKGFFLIKGELEQWRVNNIIGAALRLGKLDWAEQFLIRHKEYLPAESRENTFTFNLARVYRYQKKFDKVLDLLKNVEYEDIGYNLISKAVLIITYYELDEFSALDSFMESFRVFLNRNKSVPEQYRIHHLNLIKFVRKLTRIHSGDKAAIAKLREEITREKATTVNHEWLLEKLAELE